jgi:hypothetical protein
MNDLRKLLGRVGRRAGLAGAVVSFAAGIAGSAGAQVLPPKPDPTCVVTPAEFNSWFVTGTPGPNQPVNPANSITLNTSTNCNFYKWSEQMFLWMTSPASGAYQGGRVFSSQVFYQLNGNNLIPQTTLGPRNLTLRAAQAGPDGLPVILDAKGHLREFVTAPSRSGVTELFAKERAAPSQVATVKTGADGKAVFLDAAGKTVKIKPIITADMLPQALGRLVRFATPSKGREAPALESTAARERIAAALTAKKVLIQVMTSEGPVFVEPGTGIVNNLSPGQAGGNGVLLSQQKSMIFYETLVNDVYAWYLTGRKTPSQGITPLYVQGQASTYGLFPTTQSDLQSVLTFSSTHGGPTSFPDQNALAFEAKLSWVDASTLPNKGTGYITTQANVPVYDTSNPTDWVPNGSVLTTVALVGVHVVGSAQGHPEMIWATFEHKDNTPLATYQYNSGGQTVTVSQNTQGSWLFSANGATSPFNAELAKYVSGTGHIVSTQTPPAAITPSNILRQKAWGVASNGVPNQNDATPADSNTEIISLNTNVLSQFGSGAGTDPRTNYLLIGATWTVNGGEPNGPYPTKSTHYPAFPNGVNEIGTSILLNSTMETFQQGPDTTFSTGTNCFGCHGSSGNNPATKANTFVSHIFSSTNPLAFP